MDDCSLRKEVAESDVILYYLWKEILFFHPILRPVIARFFSLHQDRHHSRSLANLSLLFIINYNIILH